MRRRIRELILSEGIAQVQLSDGLINDLIDCGHIVSLKAGQPLVKVGDVNLLTSISSLTALYGAGMCLTMWK